MAKRRWKRIEHCGRPKKPPNRNRLPPVDHGTPQLRGRKFRATKRDDIELTGPGILYGHGHLDRHQYDQLGEVAVTLQLLAKNLGPRPNAVANLWRAIVGAGIGAAYSGVPSSIGELAGIARTRLERMLSRLDGSRDLVIAVAESRPLPLIERVLEGAITDADPCHIGTITVAARRSRPPVTARAAPPKNPVPTRCSRSAACNALRGHGPSPAIYVAAAAEGDRLTSPRLWCVKEGRWRPSLSTRSDPASPS
jgi:hypothetical protein